MKDQLSSSGAEHAPTEETTEDRLLREVRQVIAEVARERAAEGGRRPHLISVDELRASGALDVPPEWRKSLAAGRDPVQRGLFDDLDE